MTNIDCNKENVSLIQYVNCAENGKNTVTTHQHPLPTQQQQQQQQPPAVDWVDTVVNCATIMNKIFARNTCRLCHIYSDKQVEFEERIQQNATITASANEWYNVQQQQNGAIYNNCTNEYDHDSIYPPHTASPLKSQYPISTEMISPTISASSSLTPVNPEAVEMYRKYLFDEESVVDSIELRIGRSMDDDDEENGDMKDVQLI